MRLVKHYTVKVLKNKLCKYLKKKNLKVLVANIWKHSGGFRRHARWAVKFRKLKVSISQPKADFAAAKLAFSLV